MNANGQDRKTVAVYDPEARSRAVILPMLDRLGYLVDDHKTSKKILSRCQGPKRVDMLFLHLAVFGETYQEVIEGLTGLALADIDGRPPLLAVTALKVSQDARTRFEQLGCNVVLSRQAPLMEVVFAVNRLLFPKIRELRRYTRVFGGFPVRFGTKDQWSEGQVYNLSREGAFIQCDEPPSEGSRIQVRFVLPDLDVPFEVDTVVSWVNQAEGDPLSPRGMGISFLALNSEASTTLGRFIDEREDPAC